MGRSTNPASGSGSETPVRLTGLPGLPSDFEEKLKETGSVEQAARIKSGSGKDAEPIV